MAIQADDLAFRKVLRDGGAAAGRLIEDDRGDGGRIVRRGAAGNRGARAGAESARRRG